MNQFSKKKSQHFHINKIDNETEIKNIEQNFPKNSHVNISKWKLEFPKLEKKTQKYLQNHLQINTQNVAPGRPNKILINKKHLLKYSVNE